MLSSETGNPFRRPTSAPLRHARARTTPFEYVLSLAVILVAAVPPYAVASAVAGADGGAVMASATARP